MSGFFLKYIILPLLFLSVALLGGMRLKSGDNSLIFLKPPLICLILAAIFYISLFKAGLIELNKWFSGDFPLRQNIANGSILLALYAASGQIFNSLLPESSIAFWIISFCFFWSLWNNLFAELKGPKFLRSFGSLFGLAFVVKYFVLQGLSPDGGSWAKYILKEASGGLLDLPKFSPATGYIQFLAVILFIGGIYLISISGNEEGSSKNSSDINS